MSIYVFNDEHKVIGTYENEELTKENIEIMTHRDFPTCASVGEEIAESVYEDEENLANEQWIASLVDRAQNAGWFILVDDGIIHTRSPLSYEAARGTSHTGWFTFENWSEVECWLNENNL